MSSGILGAFERFQWKGWNYLEKNSGQNIILRFRCLIPYPNLRKKIVNPNTKR
jgi:hypothetical protein